MRRHFFRYAGIIFTVTIKNNDFAKPYLDNFKVEPAAEARGIIIDAVIEPRAAVVNNGDRDKPPDVTLIDDTLTIVHRFYDGTYDLKKGEGKASVNSLFSLMAFIRLIVSVVIVDQGGLAIHSSCILQNNKAHIFSGPSGRGKSTIIKLTGEPKLYSDEVTLVRKDESGSFWVYHSPFRSEFYTHSLQPTNDIAGLFFIEQDTHVYLEPLTQTQALIKLLSNVFFPITQRNPYEPKIFQLCLDFISQVRTSVLHFKKNDSFWRCINE